MNYRDLYAKLSELDEARGDTVSSLKTIQDEIRTDLNGVSNLLAGIIDQTLPSLTTTQLTTFDAAFSESGISFSPAAAIADAEATRTARVQGEQKLLAKHGVPDLAAVRGLADARKGDGDAADTAISTAETRKAAIDLVLKPVTDYNADPRTKLKITSENFSKFTGAIDHSRWLFSGDYRRGRAALAAVHAKSKVGYAAETRDLSSVNATLASHRDARSTARTAQAGLNADLTAYGTLVSAEISKEAVRGVIHDQVMDGLAVPAFVSALQGLVPETLREDFVTAVVQKQGLTQARDFIKGKISGVEKERHSMSGTLGKLRRAKSSNGSKSARGAPSAEELDRAIAGTRLQGAYFARNGDAIRRQTLKFGAERSPSSSFAANSSNDMLNFQMGMLWGFIFTSGQVDPACTRDAFGLTNEHCAAMGVQQDMSALTPDYGATVVGLAQDAGNSGMLQTLGIDTTALSQIDTANFGNIDVGQVDVGSGFAAAAGSFQVDVPNIQVDVPNISIDVGTISVPTIDVGGGGGGFSGGFDGGVSVSMYKEDAFNDMMLNHTGRSKFDLNRRFGGFHI